MFDAIATLEEAVDKVAASEARVDIARMRAAIERLEHAWLERVRDAELRGEWLAEGHVSTAAWLREKCRMTHGAATAAIELATAPGAVARDLGGVRARHDLARARAGDRARRNAGADRGDRPRSRLRWCLRRKPSSPKQLRDLVQRVTDAIDGDGGAADACTRHERRRLHVSPTLDGMVAIDGLLDAEGGEIVISALESAMQSARCR